MVLLRPPTSDSLGLAYDCIFTLNPNLLRMLSLLEAFLLFSQYKICLLFIRLLPVIFLELNNNIQS